MRTQDIQAGKDKNHPGLTIDTVYEYDLDSTLENLNGYCNNTDGGHHGIFVPDYVDGNVSTKEVRITQSYVGVVNKMVWR